MLVNFIGKDIKLEPVRLHKDDSISGILEYYMGKNTPERQDFIIANLKIEDDVVEEEVAEQESEIAMAEEQV